MKTGIRQFLNRLSMLCLFCFSVGVVGAADEEEKNPFMRVQPKQAAAPVSRPTANPLDHIEFNGYMSLGGRKMISLYDTKARRSYWVKLNEENEAGLKVIEFDSPQNGGNSIITLVSAGHRKKIQLKNSDIVTLQPRVAPSTNTAVTQALPREAPSRPTGDPEKASDEEVRDRMKRVADEIRRRRAMRRTLVEGRKNK